MGVVQGLGHRCHQIRCLAKRRSIVPDPLRQCAAFDVLGDDEAREILRAADIVDGDDMRMVQLGNDACFGEICLGVFEARNEPPVGHLDRNKRSNWSSWAR